MGLPPLVPMRVSRAQTLWSAPKKQLGSNHTVELTMPPSVDRGQDKKKIATTNTAPLTVQTVPAHMHVEPVTIVVVCPPPRVKDGVEIPLQWIASTAKRSASAILPVSPMVTAVLAGLKCAPPNLRVLERTAFYCVGR